MDGLKVIGLTGGIASGKSTVSLLLKQKGAVIIDADVIAKKQLQKGTITWERVIKYFGQEIVNADGQINRKKLGNLVFSDPEKLKILNKLTHPEIFKEIKTEITNCKNNNIKIVVVDAALLIETGLWEIADEVWVVYTDEKVQLQRLMLRESINEAQALSRIKSQMSSKERLKYADKVINNTGDIIDTKKQVDSLWRDLQLS